MQVTLHQPDALFANLMTFPVAKWDGSRYIGTGRYRLASQGEDSVLLERNPSYWGKQPSIQRIEMIPLKKTDVETYSLKLGKIDCLYIDGASADISNLSAGSYPVTANQLIFLGANASRGQTANAEVRKAISRAIDRDYLMRTSLTTSGKASDLPLHPDFFAMEGYTVPAQNIDEAKQMLTQAGALDDGEMLELTLLYSTDGADRAQLANQLAAQLAQVGIQITLDGRASEDYFSALESGSYDLYLGELLLGDDMDLSHLFTRGEHYGYGAAPSQQLLSLYQTAYKCAYRLLHRRGMGCLCSAVCAGISNGPACLSQRLLLLFAPAHLGSDRPAQRPVLQYRQLAVLKRFVTVVKFSPIDLFLAAGICK